MRLTVVLTEDRDGGYTAQCVEIPGAISEGDTRKEALENIQDAIELILDVRRQEARTGPGVLETVEVDAEAGT